jgi:hypothetical protein
MDMAPQIVAALGIGLMLPFIALPIARMLEVARRITPAEISSPASATT